MEPAQSVHGITVMLDQETLRQNGHLTVEEFLNQQMDFQVWLVNACNRCLLPRVPVSS